ncbi:MAG: hypothetical protein KGI97_08055 [Alphaproteobacteria bacterium]|nr:hypothetical protein [Alphaproteobacteria bacterium]
MATSDKITPAQVLFPLCLLSFVVVIFLGFQTSLLVNARSGFEAAKTQQEKPLAQIGKVRGQLNALISGTVALSHQGNKDAEKIVKQLEAAGVKLGPQEPPPPPAKK